jgi:elongator complex protein 3
MTMAAPVTPMAEAGARGDGGGVDPAPVEYLDDVIAALMEGGVSVKADVLELKIRLCRKYSLPRIPRDSEILARAHATLAPSQAEALVPLLRKKPYRTASGIAAVAVMTSPHECPHGTCAYCPGGPGKGTAQSYTGREPASLRAHAHGFDPCLQVRSRVEQLRAIGHPTDKVELIIMGGTFTARDPGYQDDFILGCFRGLNGACGASDPNGCAGEADEDGGPEPEGEGEPAALVSPALAAAHAANESAAHRCTGMTIETRPDHCGEEHVDRVLAQGGTRVELGVQNLHDHILEGVKRGHTSEQTTEATRLLRDAGLKVGYHMMPFLPGSDEELEMSSFHMAFCDPRFMPDLLKIYPTLVMEGTPVYDLWKAGDYQPPDTARAARLVARVKETVPPWVRISRIQRDIPAGAIAAGVGMSNLRQVAVELMDRDGRRCRCIRCREVGHRLGPDAGANIPAAEPGRIDYDAGGGKEVFLSLDIAGSDALVAFARLRLPSPEAHRPELCDGDASVIRELKVLGPMAPIPGGGDELWQHKGLGAGLLDRAAQVSRDEWGVSTMLVTSGVGARPYYRKFGFERVGPYMGLKL